MRSPSRSPLLGNAVAWALLSQSLWLPLLAIDLHDRWQAKVRDQAEIAAGLTRVPTNGGQPLTVPTSAPAESAQTIAARAADPGLLLGSSRSGGAQAEGPRTGILVETGQGVVLGQQPSASRRSAAEAPRINGGSAPIRLGWHGSSDTTSLLQPQPLLGGYSRAELLGGSLGLGDLRSGSMPPLALAERARWARSGDPLAPLPSSWREPMRKAIGEMPAKQKSPMSISGARVVHVPSTRVKHSTVVPLALQPDGSVDILTQPDNPAVVEEIRQWSARQSTSGHGGVTAAVVHLEPLPESPRPLTPPMLGARLAAPATPAAPSPAAASRPAAPSAVAAPSAAPVPAVPVVAAPVAAAPVAAAPAPAAAAPAAPVAAAAPAEAAPAAALQP